MTLIVADLHAETAATSAPYHLDSRLAVQAADIAASLPVTVVQESDPAKARILDIVVDRLVVHAQPIPIRAVVKNNATPDALAGAKRTIPHDRAHGVPDIEHDKPAVDPPDFA